MEPSESPLLEPIEYEERLERARNIENPLEQHNAALALLQGARRDRHTAGDPQYDAVIRALERLEERSRERLTRADT